MTTQYTTILKLALPVQGELSGTWGDVVNDNITEMVEQAIAGKATINSWTGNSHTLTTADGTTSESRCAILELTDSGTALTGAGTVVCPTNTKLYIVDNNTAEIVTVKTSGGTGVAVPVGKTMLVYCDGTNVVEGVTHANSLSLGTSTVTADKILDEDNMASDSATAIATQQSIKAYVDSQVGTVDTLSEILANGNTTGANDIDVDSAQKVQFRDADIYLNSSVDGQLDIVADGEVQIDTALVDINGNLDVSGTTNISGSVSFTKNAIAGVAISTTSRSSNTVTVTTSAVHGLTSGDLVNVNGVADTSFNGYFTASVSSTTVFTYSQTGADGSSTGGTSTEVVYNLNASGTALNWMNGPLNIAANSGIDGLEITQSGSGNGLHVTGTTGLVGNTTLTGNLDVSGDIDVDGTTNLDVVDIDGAVDMASTLAVGSRIAIGQTSFSGGSILLDLHGSGSGTGSQASFYNDHNTSGFQIGLAGNTSGDVIFYNVANTDMDFYTNNLLRFSIAADGSLSTPTAGISNVRFGVNAGNSIASGGNYNTVVGDEAGTAINTGDNNSFFGYEAGDANNTGSNNTVMGYAAYSAATSGVQNTVVGGQAAETYTGNYSTMIGQGAGQLSTTAGSLVLIGQGAGRNKTTGNYSIHIGESAGFGATSGVNNTGANNISIGGISQYQITSGFENVAVGHQAQRLMTSGSHNVGIGPSALFTCDTGTYNTVVGSAAGLNISSGAQNTLIGGLAGDALTVAFYNTALGYSSLSNDLKGYGSTAIGFGTLASQQFGAATTVYNTAVGYNAGATVSSGIQNTLIGANAGDALLAASDNVAVGFDALSAETGGQNNVAVGTRALQAQVNSSGNIYNTAVGSNAGKLISSGSGNTAVGGNSLDALLTGNNNSAFGVSAGSGLTSGSNNLFLGASAGEVASTGTENTFVGNVSGSAVTTGSKNTILGRYNGNQSGLDMRTLSNIVMLSDGDGNIVHHQGNQTVGDEGWYDNKFEGWYAGARGLADFWVFQTSAFSNPVTNLITMSGGQQFATLMVRVEVHQKSWANAQGNIHAATALCAVSATISQLVATTSTMVVLEGSSGQMTSVGTLAWSGSDGDSSRILQYTPNRVSNYDSYDIRVTATWRGGGTAYSNTTVHCY